WRRSARATVEPTTMIPGAPLRGADATPARVPRQAEASGREAENRIAAGVSAGHPRARSNAEVDARVAIPIRITSVAEPGDRERSTGPEASSACPEPTTKAA